jgi:hypothetical protein
VSDEPHARPDLDEHELDERRGDRLRQLLTVDEPAADEVVPTVERLGEVQRRVEQRRHRKLAGIGLAAAVALLVGATALGLGHRSSGSTALGAGSAASSGPPFQTTTTGPNPVARSGSCAAPVGGACSDGSSVPVPIVGPDTDLPSPTTPTSGAVPTDQTGSAATVPLTTIPAPGTSVEPPTMPTVGGSPHDCGSWGPSGWPTTIPPPPSYASCIVDAFNRGTPATFTVTTYEDDPAHPVTTTYIVTGVHVVLVRSDRRQAQQPPTTLTVSTCTGLVTLGGDASLVRADGCTETATGADAPGS